MESHIKKISIPVFLQRFDGHPIIKINTEVLQIFSKTLIRYQEFARIVAEEYLFVLILFSCAVFHGKVQEGICSLFGMEKLSIIKKCMRECARDLSIQICYALNILILAPFALCVVARMAYMVLWSVVCGGFGVLAWGN